jgi:hypothetical protein
MLRLCVALLIGACAASDATAQVVRGTVRDNESGAALQGVFVMLLDSTAQMRGAVLTDDKGVFAMRAPFAGTFTLRAERIGHQAASSTPVVLSPDEARTVDFSVTVAAIALAPVEVETRTRCIARPRSGQRTAQLWEEARKALTVARWVESQKSVQFSARTYTREMDVMTRQVRSEGVRHDVTRSLPYAAVDADTLARYGFVRNEGAGMVFYGPDADVLLSQAFLDGHCFHSVEGSGENQGMIGLGFRPTLGSSVPDIEGVLWLDRSTLELRHIEYRYTNVDRAYRGRETGGRTEFLRLKSGAWIVSKWYIRMPTVIASGFERGEYRVVSLFEEGGEVLRVQDESSEQTLTHDGTINGAVYDSVAGRPLAGALVYLSGTSHQATTDENGRYEIRGVAAGRYTISFSHAALDSMPLPPEPRTLEVRQLEPSTADLAIKPAAGQLTELCAGYRGHGVVFGFVRNDRASGVADAAVTMQAGTLRAVARSDAAGSYFICNVPLDAPFTVQAARSEQRSPMVPLRITRLPFRRLDLTLKD